MDEGAGLRARLHKDVALARWLTRARILLLTDEGGTDQTDLRPRRPAGPGLSRPAAAGACKPRTGRASTPTAAISTMTDGVSPRIPEDRERFNSVPIAPPPLPYVLLRYGRVSGRN